jgi:hypothetical protein
MELWVGITMCRETPKYSDKHPSNYHSVQYKYNMDSTSGLNQGLRGEKSASNGQNYGPIFGTQFFARMSETGHLRTALTLVLKL